MSNEQNLKPQNKRSKERQRAIARKGGQASAESRRKRKQLKEELLILLEKGDTQEKMCISIIAQAQKGNVRAFETICNVIGEKPAESIEISKKTSTIIEEIEAYINGNE